MQKKDNSIKMLMVFLLRWWNCEIHTVEYYAAVKTNYYRHMDESHRFMSLKKDIKLHTM